MCVCVCERVNVYIYIIKARLVRGDADRRSQEALGGYVWVACRKTYLFCYHTGLESEGVRSFSICVCVCVCLVCESVCV